MIFTLSRYEVTYLLLFAVYQQLQALISRNTTDVFASCDLQSRAARRPEFRLFHSVLILASTPPSLQLIAQPFQISFPRQGIGQVHIGSGDGASSS